MKNLKRLLAVIGIILLAGMYVLTLVFALTDNSAAGNMVMASLYATVMIPVLLYAFLLVHKWTHPKKEEISRVLENTSDVDTVIFDIGNVLAKYDWKKLLKEMNYDEKTTHAVADAMFLSKDWAEADRGIRTEEEILQSFIANNPSYEKEIRATFSKIEDTISVYSYTKDWLAYLKKRGYKLYFLSNFPEPLCRRCLDRLNFLELMDGGYMSWQVHLLKPEPEMYRKLIQDFQITPEKAVFIDDYMDNVAEARAQGLNAIHFTGRKSAVQQLADFGVK